MTTESELKKRSEFVSEVEDFLETCQQDINGLLRKLEWSEEYLLKKDEQMVCPHDNGHIMSKDTLTKHTPVCNLLKKGVPRSDIKSESKHSSQFFYEKTSQIGRFDIDKETLNKVLWDHHVTNHSIFYGQSELPLTTDDAVAMLTPGERAAVYSYIVQKAKKENKMVGLEKDNFLTTDFQEIMKKKGLEELNAKPKSYHEYLKAMRDYKRRRQSYRAKNVHITKKSYTEIIKEVIENQTEYLTEIIRQDEEENGVLSDQQKSMASTNENDLPDHETYRYRNEGQRIEHGEGEHDFKGEHNSKRRRSRSRERSRSRGRDRHKHKKRRRSRESSYRHEDLERHKDKVKREEKSDAINASVDGYHGDTHRSRSRDSSGSRKSDESHQLSTEEHSRSRDRSRSRHKKSRKKHKHKRHKSHKS